MIFAASYIAAYLAATKSLIFLEIDKANICGEGMIPFESNAQVIPQPRRFFLIVRSNNLSLFVVILYDFYF